jgi:hypothetical protein
MLGKLLNIPDESLPNLVVDAYFVEVGDGQAVLTYGKVFDARVATRRMDSSVKKAAAENSVFGSPRPLNLPPVDGRTLYSEKPLIPDDKRDWYSPMTFCIANGRLTVDIWTVDWKSGDCPM